MGTGPRSVPILLWIWPSGDLLLRENGPLLKNRAREEIQVFLDVKKQSRWESSRTIANICERRKWQIVALQETALAKWGPIEQFAGAVLGGEAYAPHHLAKSRIRAQAIEPRVGSKPSQEFVSVIVGLFEQLKGLIILPKSRID